MTDQPTETGDMYQQALDEIASGLARIGSEGRYELPPFDCTSTAGMLIRAILRRRFPPQPDESKLVEALTMVGVKICESAALQGMFTTQEIRQLHTALQALAASGAAKTEASK